MSHVRNMLSHTGRSPASPSHLTSSSSPVAAGGASTALVTGGGRPASRARHPAPALTLDGESYASTLVLDLRDQACNDLHVLNSKFPGRAAMGDRSGSHSHSGAAHPWRIIILSGNMLSRLDGLHRCTMLRKLDLSRNGIDTLPKASFWKQLKHLQVLFLHQNKLDSIHALQQLSALPALEILTCFGNAVEHHPAYRHVMVNVNTHLRLLDFFIVSDAELIEGAQWGKGNKFATYATTLECDILNMHQAFDGSEKSHMQVLEAQLEIVRKQHRRFSPVLKIQSLFRGVLVRRTIRVYHQAACAIQMCWRRYRAKKFMQLNEQDKDGANVTSKENLFADRQKPNPLTSLAAHTIFLVHTSDVAVSLFMQLVRRVEQAEGIVAPDLVDGNMLLLSPPNIRDDYPLVRRVFIDRPPDGRTGCTIRPGRHCTQEDRRALAIIHPRPAGSVMNEHQRFIIENRIRQHTYSNRFLQFQSPGSRFHELLIRAVHKYNIEVGNYNDDEDDENEPQPPSLDPNTSDLAARAELQYALQVGGKAKKEKNMNRVIIYPGTTISVIAAAVSIQSVFRAYRARKWIVPSLGRRVVEIRAVTCLVRWWRGRLFRLRMHLLSGLKRYGDSINSRHLFCRGDILYLLRSSPNAFVDKEFMPEHKTIFGVEPKEEDTTGGGYINRMHPAKVLDGDGEPIGKMTLVVDRNTGKRFYPFPRWLANHWNHHPLPVVHGFTDTGIRVDLSSRMTELIKEGVHISVLPDVSQPAALDHRQPESANEWTPSNFIKLTFASVEEARNRALTLAINTWLPSFHLLRPSRLRASGPFTSSTPASQLAGAEMAFLMTPQHMTLCLQYQQAGGPSGPSGERHILYTTFWTKSKTAPPALYSNQAYLDLQYQLKLVEEAHIAAEKLEQREVQIPTASSNLLSSDSASRSSDELAIEGDVGLSTYQPSVFALKREAAESERLMSRRMVAQARVKIHTEKLANQEHAREQTIMHRIKMETLAEREIEARRQRQLDYERMDAAARAARDRLLAAKHAQVHRLKADMAQRAKLRELDRDLDSKALRKQVIMEKMLTQKHLDERHTIDTSKIHEKVLQKKEDQHRHRRLIEEKENTLAFLSQQNMISRQLTAGMRNRLKVHQQQKIVATVQARREVAHQRRHQVHQILFENFNRRRQVNKNTQRSKESAVAALAQQLELKSHVQMRAVKDENKVNLMRARRQHLASVRALASSAAISTLNSHTLPTQQELHAALANSSAHFTPFARPATSPESTQAAYLPNSALRTVIAGGSPHSSSSLPPIRASPPPPPANPLQAMAGDQLTMQINVLRDLADRVKLQYQTAANNNRYMHQQPPTQ